MSAQIFRFSDYDPAVLCPLHSDKPAELRLFPMSRIVHIHDIKAAKDYILRYRKKVMAQFCPKPPPKKSINITQSQ
jgi:hypothetical protein